MATYPNPSITYKASDMTLWISSDSVHLSVPQARSYVRGCNFLGDAPGLTKPLAQQCSFINAHMHVESSILRNAMGAASKAEIAGGACKRQNGCRTTHDVIGDGPSPT